MCSIECRKFRNRGREQCSQAAKQVGQVNTVQAGALLHWLRCAWRFNYTRRSSAPLCIRPSGLSLTRSQDPVAGNVAAIKVSGAISPFTLPLPFLLAEKWSLPAKHKFPLTNTLSIVSTLCKIFHNCPRLKRAKKRSYYLSFPVRFHCTFA